MKNSISAIQKVKSAISSLSLSHDYSNDLDEYIRILTNQRVNFVVTGEFSSGKSSLINTMINYNLLPTADIPMTSKRVEIYHKESPIIKCYWSTKASKIAQAAIEQIIILLEDANRSDNEKSFLHKIKWEHDYTQFSYTPSQPASIQNFLWIVESSQLSRDKNSTTSTGRCEHKKKAKGIGDLWDVVVEYIKNICFRSNSKHEPPKNISVDATKIERIEIGLPLPEKLRNACFIDIPGEGALESHVDLIKQSALRSQVILHVLDGGHIGSKTEDQLIELTKTNDSEILFVLNKKDILSADGLNSALSLLNKKYNATAIPVSVLYAWTAHSLLKNYCTVEDVFDKPKINVKRAVFSPAWRPGDLEQNKGVLADFLMQESCIDVLRLQIEKITMKGNIQIEKFVYAKVRNILRDAKRQIEVLSKNVSESNEITMQKKLVDNLDELLQNMRLKTHEVKQTLNATLREHVATAFNDLLCEHKKLLSSALSVNYCQLESDSTSVLKTKFSQINMTWRVQNIWSAACVTSITRYCNELSMIASAGFPTIETGTWRWNNESTFSQSVVSKTDLIVKCVLGNAIGRPAFAAFRPGAMAEFVKKQKTICLSRWEAGMNVTFQAEQSNVECDIKNKIDALLAPVGKYLDSMQDEVSRQRKKLVQMQDVQNSKVMSLRNTQDELRKLAVFFSE